EDSPVLECGALAGDDRLAEAAFDELLVREGAQRVLAGALLGLAKRVRAEDGTLRVQGSDRVRVGFLPALCPAFHPGARRCCGVHAAMVRSGRALHQWEGTMFVAPVPDEDLPDELAADAATLGSVPNYFRVFAHRPAAFAAGKQLVRAV